MMKLVILSLLLPSCVVATGRRGIDYNVQLKPPAHPAAVSDTRNPDSAPPLTPIDSSKVPKGSSKFLGAARFFNEAYKSASDAYKGVVGAKIWGETHLRRSGSMADTEAAALPSEAPANHNTVPHERPPTVVVGLQGVVGAKFWGNTGLRRSGSMADPKAAAPLDASASYDRILKPPTLLVGLQDLGSTTYKYILAMVSSLRSSPASMLRAHQDKASSSQNTESLQPTTTQVVAGTVASAGGHRMTTHKGSVHQSFEDTAFGRSPLAWEAIAIISLYALIGANTGSIVARAFQWPWLTSMFVNIFIWPVVAMCYLLLLIFGRGVATRHAKKAYFGAAAAAKNTPDAKPVSSALKAVDEAWCAYHVAHASHDLCIAKINNKHGVNEVVTPESLGKESRTSEKGALRWYRWLLGSTSELTVGAVHVKTAELHCADASKICNTLFAIYHEDGLDTLSITDALNVLQGWAAGKYGAQHIKSDDMNYLINTLLAVLLSKSKCGSVNKADWMKLADDYPEFFDVEPQYPQHVRYLRLIDSFRPELAQNLPRELFSGGSTESYKKWWSTSDKAQNMARNAAARQAQNIAGS